MSIKNNNISFHGEDQEKIETLQTVFKRAGIIDQNFKNDSDTIGKDQSILVITENGDLKKYNTYLKKMNAGLEKGSLSNGFVWYPKNETKSKEGLESLISSHLSRNILYSRESFIIRFVEDVIKNLETKTVETIKGDEKNMSIFYNVLDNNVGEEVSEMLSDIFKINKVPVDISDEKSNINNLSTLALEAKLAVVVFDQQKEWAELFTQEIWKKIGGVSSGIPILLIGTNSNDPSKISIPNVTLAEAGKELLSLEIKIQYDSLTEN